MMKPATKTRSNRFLGV